MVLGGRVSLSIAIVVLLASLVIIETQIGRKSPSQEKVSPRSASLVPTKVAENQHTIHKYIKLLKDKNWRTRHKAIAELGKLKDPRSVEFLMQSLKDESSQVRSNAAWALGNIKDRRAVGVLIKALDDKDHTVRGTAAWALGEMRDHQALDPLISRLADKHQEVRYETMFALVKMESPKAQKAIIGAIEKEDKEISSGIAEALSDSPDPHLPSQPGSQDESNTTSQKPSSKGENTGNGSSGEPLSSTPPQPPSNSEYRGVSNSNPNNMPISDQLEALIKELKDADTQTRIEAIRELGELGDRRALPALIELLQEGESDEVRSNAAWALGQLGDGQAIDELLQALQNPSSQLRTSAILALAKLHALQALDEIIQLLITDESTSVRSTAALALGELRDEQAVDGLMEALQDRRRSVRGNAAWALGEIGDPSVIAALERALQAEADESTRSLIREAIQKLRSQANQ